MAESYGLFVALHFAAGPSLDTLNAQPPPTISKVQAVAAAHVAWATEFIQYLNVANSHKNILVWGAEYALIPAGGSYCPQPVNAASCNNFSLMAQLIYQGVHAAVANTHPPTGVGLVGADLNFGLNEPNDNMIVRPSTGYPFTWASAQITAYIYNQLIGTAPDIWLLQYIRQIRVILRAACPVLLRLCGRRNGYTRLENLCRRIGNIVCFELIPARHKCSELGGRKYANDGQPKPRGLVEQRSVPPPNCWA